MSSRLPGKLAGASAYARHHGVATMLRDKLLDPLVHAVWAQRIHWTPRRFTRRLGDIPIRAPIFLLGTQGAGGTLVSRLLRQHPDLVYASGNHRFWGGEDELHNKARFKKLSDTWALRSPGYLNLRGNEVPHPVWGRERSWLYATDEFLPAYRRTAADWTPEIEVEIQTVVRRCLRAYADDLERARFHDMSQSYALKVPLLRRIFPDARFIVVLRDPFAMCWRALDKEYAQHRPAHPELDDAYLLDIACQQWNNTYRIALDDLGDDGLTLRYEDFCAAPERHIDAILAFTGLSPARYRYPHPEDRVPLGTLERAKWVPVRPSQNRVYRDQIPDWAKARIGEQCADLIARFRYDAAD